MQPIRKHTINTEFDITKIDSLPRVDIVYAYANDTDVFVNVALKVGTKGTAHSGIGNGNPYLLRQDALVSTSKQNVVVVGISRVGSGRTNLNREVDDAKYGLILNAQKARVLLTLALSKTSDKQKI